MPPYNVYGNLPAQRRNPNVRGKNVPIPKINVQSQVAGTQAPAEGARRQLQQSQQVAQGSFQTAQAKGAQLSLPRLGPVPMQGGGGSIGASTGGFGRNPETPGMLRAYQLGQQLGFSSIGGYADHGHVKNSDHYRNRAYDFMTRNPQQGYGLVSQLQPQWSQLGIKYIIYNGQINKGNGWQTYHAPNGRTDDTSMHRDHVHVSFY